MTKPAVRPYAAFRAHRIGATPAPSPPTIRAPARPACSGSWRSTARLRPTPAKNIQPGTAWSNASGYSNPEFDAVVDTAAVEPDAEKRKALLACLQVIAQTDVPFHLAAGAEAIPCLVEPAEGRRCEPRGGLRHARIRLAGDLDAGAQGLTPPPRYVGGARFAFHLGLRKGHPHRADLRPQGDVGT